MKVLIIKTSSMGDIIHTLPALTDAGRAIPGLKVHWMVEESFSEIPLWHSQVERVIPIALRRWRKHKLKTSNLTEFSQTLRAIRAETFDLVIDAQGLVKSALLTRLARGPRYGLDWNSAREPIANFAYEHKFSVNRNQHAVSRSRELFAKIFQYDQPLDLPQYGLDRSQFIFPQEDYVVFLHGTTWITKLWPEKYWQVLALKAVANGLKVKLLWGNEEEKKRAERIKNGNNSIEVLPRLRLVEIAGILAGAQGIVAVDTGFAHLAAALAIPTVSIYGSTNAALTGCQGLNQKHLNAEFSCSPCLQKVCSFQGESSISPACYEQITPEKVWSSLEVLKSLLP